MREWELLKERVNSLPFFGVVAFIIMLVVLVVVYMNKSKLRRFFVERFSQMKENSAKSWISRMMNKDNDGVYVDGVNKEEINNVIEGLQILSRWEDRYIALEKDVGRLVVEVTQTPAPHSTMLMNEDNINIMGQDLGSIKATLGVMGSGKSSLHSRLENLETVTPVPSDYRIVENQNKISEAQGNLDKLRNTVTDTSTTANRLDNYFFPKLNNSVITQVSTFFGEIWETILETQYETLEREDKIQMNKCLSELVNIFEEEDLTKLKRLQETTVDLYERLYDPFSEKMRALNKELELVSHLEGLKLAETIPLREHEGSEVGNENDFYKEIIRIRKDTLQAIPESVVSWKTGIIMPKNVYEEKLAMYGYGNKFTVVWPKGQGQEYLVGLKMSVTLLGSESEPGFTLISPATTPTPRPTDNPTPTPRPTDNPTPAPGWRNYNLLGTSLYQVDADVEISEDYADLLELQALFSKYDSRLREHMECLQKLYGIVTGYSADTQTV